MGEGETSVVGHGSGGGSAGTAHPTAVVEDGARIGPGSRVWHHAHVRSGAVIGADCTIGKNVYVDAGAVIGDRCKVQNNVSVFDGVTLEDEVFVGPSAVFTNDFRPRAVGSWSITPTVVRRGASVGANATLVCGIEVGSYALVAAGAVVTRTVEPHAVVAGNPARFMGWACRCAAQIRRGDWDPSMAGCERCRDGAAGQPSETRGSGDR